MHSKLCLVVGGSFGYFKPADHLGLIPMSDIDEIGSGRIKLAIFTGGEDVDPSVYDHPKWNGTYSNIDRDRYEIAAFEKCLKAKIPMLGICRGAQFLCAMAGGKLVQDVTNHGQYHYLKFINEKGEWEVSPEKVTSTHHQMQFPWTIKGGRFKILAGSPQPISRHYAFEKKLWKAGEEGEIPAKMQIEPDVVFYQDINALGIQYHPEWMDNTSWGMKYARRLIDKLMSGEL